MEILSFFAGIAFFYFKNPYPIILIIAFFFFRPRCQILLFFFFAIIWCMLHQTIIEDKGISKEVKIFNHATLQGHIYSIPIVTSDKTQFSFKITSLNNKKVKINALMSCYKNCPKFEVGQFCEFKAKLKRPINLGNPKSFDYVSWLGSKHISWVGNIENNTVHLTNAKTIYKPFVSIRAKLNERLEEIYLDKNTLGIFQALTLGLTHYISKEQWDLFRRTGTTHLIDISGEHIALIGGFTYAIFKIFLRFIPKLVLKIPIQTTASIGAIIIGFLYSLIAGFTVPTQRALVTAILMMVHNFCSKRLSIWQAWRYALFGVLLLEPHSVFMLGFYFSFIAVAILILINQRYSTKGIKKILIMQFACLVGLMPLSLYWFSYISFSGMLANLFAIPLVGFIIVPLALIITFLSNIVVIPGTIFILQTLINFLLIVLQYIDKFLSIDINFSFPEVYLPLACMTAMLLLIFCPVRIIKPAGAILFIASFFPHFEKIKNGEGKIDVLDVGQGLAVLVRTKNHTLIYDTGVKFYKGSDIGKLVLIPYLKKLGIKKIDKVVISHPDMDHRGGLESLEKEYKINEFIFDNPTFYKKGVSCHNYPSWQWDDVTFRFFPIQKQLKSKNNNSCILQIANRKGKMLLTGDIEKIGEYYLIDNYKEALASTVLLVPHHASKTSSTNEFLKVVNPKYAVASYGFDNRYHFPHQELVKRYEQNKIKVYNTMDSGMISISLLNADKPPVCFR